MGFEMHNKLGGEQNHSYSKAALRDISDFDTYMPRREAVYSINVSLKYKYVYVENPKVACSHIKRCLQRMELRDPEAFIKNVHDRTESPLIRVDQLRVDQLLHIFNSNEFFKFTFVRNPFTRTLSAYLDKIGRNEKHKRSILLALGRNPDDLEQFVSFPDFTQAIATLNPYLMDNHWRPQTDQVLLPLVRYDFIGRFEHFERDFSKVVKTITDDSQPPVDNDISHQTGAGAALFKYYDEECAEVVRNVYARDFQHFGYSTELCSDNRANRHKGG
jgi:hypothetical protein